MYNIYRVK